jgi:predicted Zn-dependent protease
MLGDRTAAELIADIDHGLYINEGEIRPNAVTGEVSASVDFGFAIENGQLAYPVKNTMVGGDFIEILKNVDAVSSDYRYEPGTILPTVRIKAVSVAGGI